MTKKLVPQCLYNGENLNVRGIAYCSNGFLLPCCWLDSPFNKGDLVKLGFYDEELKLSNNEKVEDIVNSKQWKNFIEIIANDHERAPFKCKKQCGS